MAQRIRSTQLVLDEVSAAATVTTLYEVDPGTRALVKMAIATSEAAAPGLIILGVSGAGGSFVPLIRVDAPTQHTVYTNQGIYAVLNEGDQLLGYVGSVTGGTLRVLVGGLVFEL